MCGFAIEVRRDGRADRDALERMGAVLEPRGPDGSGVWVDRGVGMVHRRLAIIDLSELGAQPMRDEAAGLTIVFNGCIYNHHELRGELIALGHSFRSLSDTEVLLRGWVQWGEDLPSHLYGMFAFAIHDGARTFLVRDRLGIKPLYLAEVGRRAARRFDAAGAAGGRRRRHARGPGRAAPLPVVALGGARAAHDPARRDEAAAGDGDGRRAGRLAAPSASIGTRRSNAGSTSTTGRARCARRSSAPCGGGWWPTCRWGSC